MAPEVKSNPKRVLGYNAWSWQANSCRPEGDRRITSPTQVWFCLIHGPNLLLFENHVLNHMVKEGFLRGRQLLQDSSPGKSCGIVSKPSKQSAKASRELQGKLLSVPYPQSETRLHNQQFHDALGSLKRRKHPILSHFEADSCHPSMFSHWGRSSSHLEVCLQEILQEAKDLKKIP